MNLSIVTFSVSYVKVNADNIKEDVVWCKFLDTDNFINSSSFLAQLKQVKKLRITGVQWEIEDCSWFDEDEVSNTIH